MEREIEFFNEKTQEYDYLYPEFDGQPHKCDDGIGSYEYWGFKGYDSNPYMSCEDTIDWNRSNFTDEENKIIGEWLEKNYNEVDEDICKGCEPDYEPDFDEPDYPEYYDGN